MVKLKEGVGSKKKLYEMNMFLREKLWKIEVCGKNRLKARKKKG